MQKYKSNITTTSGAAVRGVPVLVIKEDGDNAALFLDRAGTAPAPNPLTTGPDGVFYFYAVNGRYSIRTTVDGVTITDDDVVLMMDPEEITVAGPIAEAVAQAQAAATAAELAVANSGIPGLIAAAQNAVVDANNAASLSATSANNAALSKTDADSARDAAVIAKNAAEAALDSFDDRYLGQKPADPATDNDGGALLVGALYFRTTAPIGMKVWTGTAWDDAYANLSSKFDKTGGNVDGNINFTGTARRITGDFSNATIANRVMFQTSTLNANTVVQTLPNGSGPGSFFGALNNSDTSNFSRLLMGISQTSASIESQAQGTGGFLPLTFVTNNAERMRIDTSGNVLATGGALGYGAGAGGTVVQATSKSTAVTLNKPCGQVTMNNAALGAGASVTFQFSNNLITTVDALILTIDGYSITGFPTEKYSVSGSVIGSGAYITVKNISAGSLSEALRINFTIIKGAAS